MTSISAESRFIVRDDIEGAGHGLFTDQPDAFAESVERFLAT